MKCSISDIANVISESIPNPAESGFDIFVGLEHYDSGEVKVTRYGSTQNLVTAVKVFRKGDILLARRNVYLKRAGLVDFDGVTSGDSIVLRAKINLSSLNLKSEDIQRFLPFVLNTEEFWNYAEKYSDGTMSKRLSPKTLLQYEFVIPDDITEKNSLLWQAFETKESYKAMIKATDEMVKSQFIEMFGDQNINDRSWPETVIRDEFILNMGKTPARANPAYWVDSGLKWISIADMAKYGKYTEDTSEHISQLAVNQCGIKSVEPGTIIMSFKLSIGRTAITSERIYTNEAIMAFNRLNPEKFDKEYLYYAFSMKDWLLDAKQAVKGATLNKESIGNSKIIVPPLDLQRHFAAILAQADKSKFELKQAIEKIDKVMRAIMQ